MASMRGIDPGVRFEIFTKVPEFFFLESLGENIGYHNVLTDVGVVQDSPLTEDLPETARRVSQFFPFDEEMLGSLAEQVKRMKCSLIVSDIAPLGIAVAEKAGLKSILIENFTWDWIYEGYLEREPGLRPGIGFLDNQFKRATFHVQTMPVCRPASHPDLVVGPTSRKPRTTREEIRSQLGVPLSKKMVLITMGGIPNQTRFMQELPSSNGVFFVVPGGSTQVEKGNNLILLPHHSTFYHPDLVYASDLIIGKTGYSTLAETYHGGIPFGYICRRSFREAAVLSDFIEKEMQGCEIPMQEFQDGTWVKYLPQLLDLPHHPGPMADSGPEIAEFILKNYPKA